MVHPIYVIDALDSTPYGFADVQLLNRTMEESSLSRLEKNVQKNKRPIEQKESYRWVGPCSEVQQTILSEAEHVTFVMDREGDIWEVFERVPGEKADVVVRSRENRRILNSKGRQTKLYPELDNQKPDGTYSIGLPRKKGRKRKQAKEVIKIYAKRWKIELFFKLLELLKSDGFNIENSQLESGRALRKLTLLLMDAATRILQLKAARGGQTTLQVEDIFEDEEIRCLELLNEKLSGNTELQKNPYPRNHLSWASWVIARLAGWKDFYSKKDPLGNKTFKVGLEKFEVLLMGYSLRQ